MADLLTLVFIFISFAGVGLGLEVVFTALGARPRDRIHMFGFSSLWYVPIYGIILPVGFYFIFPLVSDYPLFVRALIYTPLFHIGEFATMGALRFLNGMSPSEESYRRSRWNIRGLTRIDYAPAMFAAALIFETLYRTLVLGEKLVH